jgi:hypothetical protein
LTPDLAHAVADQLMAHDALGAHARDELGITAALQARPVQAALTSALTFAVGAALPLGLLLLASDRQIVAVVGVGVAPVLGSLGGPGGSCRWGAHASRSHACGVLGRAGNGAHGDHWYPVGHNSNLKIGRHPA